MKIYYWDNFYQKKIRISKPSSFAKFIVKKLKKNKTLLDIGCGNGRDTFYFNKKGLNVVGLEKSKIAVKNNKKLLAEKKIKNIDFFNINISSKKFQNLKKFDYVYLRFVIHAISQKIENKLLKNLSKITKKNSIVFFEFRTTKDQLFKKGKILSKYERHTNHYRRFIEFDDFITTLNKLNNFKILYKTEKKGLAKYKNDNPVLGRIILKRK